MSSSGDDMPLAGPRPPTGHVGDFTNMNGTLEANGKRKPRDSLTKVTSYKENDDRSGDEDDVPLSKKRRTSKGKTDDRGSAATNNLNGSAPASTKVNGTGSGSSVKSTKNKSSPAAVKREKLEDDDDAPLSKKVSRKSQSNGKSPKPKKAANATSEPVVKTETKKKSKIKKEETCVEEEIEAEEDEYKWWEDPTKGDGTKKWTTLEHAGVVFPPPYEPLPKSVKLVYDGKPVNLHPDAEEVASFFGTMLNSEVNVSNPTFCKNFFHDFQQELKKTGGATDRDGNKVTIDDFGKCDFQQIFNFYDAQRTEKKNLPKEEKKRLKDEKEAAEAPYLYCLWDGRKQKVGNFRVEPPGLFRGRGQHPKTGHVKKRVWPEQITINIGKEATVPRPPEGHTWKEIKHDQEGTWLATWQENINGAYKYVMLAANSDVKGQSDYKKFEKARELKKHIDKIRKHYTTELKDKIMANRQRATAMYLIDQFALRAGNEKGEDEADTVGCCSLKFEHVTLKPPNTVIFDFLGKDSIRFYDEVEVTPQVFKNLKIFKQPPKRDGDDIFDRLTTSALNKHLANFMPGLTAKVFRTYNASFTMSNLLRDLKLHGTIPEKIKDYNEANRRVAILCNHKRTVNAGHETQMEKLGDRIKGLRYQKWRMKQMMLDLDPKQKKKHGAEWFELGDELDESWIQEHQTYLVEDQRNKIEKKFHKENEKLRTEGEKEMKESELKERLKEADELAKKYDRENKRGKVEAEGKSPSIERLEASLAKLDQRIATMSVQAEDKESNKEVALGTSKINYIDPRLTVVFSKKFNVPIEKFFSKVLREKFEWAVKSVDEHWEF